MSSSEDDILQEVEGLEDDLFGSDEGEGEGEGEGNQEENKLRELSDRELDSGDDEGRSDRAPEKETGELEYDETRDARILDSTIWRHPLPKPVGGEVSLLSMLKVFG
jgi:RNA polymerase-associated protein LEO1